jgi:GDPmannose 4,6-dehydratase
LDIGNIQSMIREYQPDEFYNLAAQSYVAVSFVQPLLTSQVNAIAVLNILEAIRLFSPHTKLYQASTSEMFGNVAVSPQSESTPFNPRSPYGIAKLFAHEMVNNYRDAYGIFGVSGILFNHESPLRGEEFVTRKISITVAKIKSGSKAPLELGNLDAKRDWGFAGEYVTAMWQMLQSSEPKDYVIATGETNTVRDFAHSAFAVAGFNLVWEGSGTEEVGIDSSSNKILVQVNKNFYRPAEIDVLVGDATKAKAELGWEASVKLDELVELMVKNDIEIF